MGYRVSVPKDFNYRTWARVKYLSDTVGSRNWDGAGESGMAANLLERTILHEIGHVLGLRYPRNGEPGYNDPDYDTPDSIGEQWSIMSYLKNPLWLGWSDVWSLHRLKDITCKITTFCPVDIEVTDSLGFRVSKTVNEITGAIYVETDLNGDGSLDDQIIIPDPISGSYSINVIPEIGADPLAKVTLTVEDHGEISTLLSEVSVIDLPTEPIVKTIDRTTPELTVSVNPSVLIPVDNRMAPITVDLSASDNDPSMTVVLAGIISSDVDDVDFVEGANIGELDTEFLLKASMKAGKTEPKIYTITYAATDSSGNVSQKSVEVKVPSPSNGDFNKDGQINLLDFAILAKYWLSACQLWEWCEDADINRDLKVDAQDLVGFIEKWIEDKQQPVLWLRADKGVTLSENAVVKWIDQSTNGYEFVCSPSGRPALSGNDPELVTNALNGHPAVRFDGGDVLTSIQNIQLFDSSSSPLTIFAVFSTTSNDIQKFLLNQQSVTGFGNFELGYDVGDYQGVGNFGLHQGYGAATATSPDVIPNNTYVILAATVKSTGAAPDNIVFYKDGEALTSVTVGGGWLSSGSYSTDSAQIDIGARWDQTFPWEDSFNNFHIGDIAEIMIFKREMNSDQIKEKNQELSDRWGLPLVSDPEGMVWVSINDPGFNGQMSKYETTNAQYCQFLNAAKASGDITVSGSTVLGSNGSNSGADFTGQVYYNLAGVGYTGPNITNGGAARINYTDGSFNVDPGLENHPVTYVSWYGATAFCNYYGYRLPIREQWHAVADYDGSFTYGCGITIDNSKANYAGTPHPYGTKVVGILGSFGYGLCDMTGNVWEWTSTPDGMYYYDCGGSFYDAPQYLLISFCRRNPPIDNNWDLGFRAVRD